MELPIDASNHSILRFFSRAHGEKTNSPGGSFNRFIPLLMKGCHITGPCSKVNRACTPAFGREKRLISAVSNIYFTIWNALNKAVYPDKRSWLGLFWQYKFSSWIVMEDQSVHIEMIRRKVIRRIQPPQTLLGILYNHNQLVKYSSIHFISN